MLIVGKSDIDTLTELLLAVRHRLVSTSGLTVLWPADTDEQRARAKALAFAMLVVMTDGDQILEENCQLVHGFGTDHPVAFPPKPVRFSKGENDVAPVQ